MLTVERFYFILFKFMHSQFISSCFCFEAPSPSSPDTHSVTYAPHKLLQMDNHVRYAINIFPGNKDASRSDY